jgi:hypothetical protein
VNIETANAGESTVLPVFINKQTKGNARVFLVLARFIPILNGTFGLP